MSTKVHPQNAFSRRGCRASLPPISDLMARAISNPSLISLAAGFVDEPTLPSEPLRQAFDAIWSDSNASQDALQYGKTRGYLPLREQLHARLAAQDEQTYEDVSADQFILTAGSNQLLYLTTDTLVDVGDIVLCASPTYFVYMGALHDLGAVAYGIETDEYGILPESLEAALERIDSEGNLDRVKAIYVVSWFDNPGGVTTTLERRHDIVNIAKRWSRKQRIFVLEDAAYRDLQFTGPDIPSMFSCDPERDTVIHTSTFSKSFSPGVRVGWGVFPEAVAAKIANLKGNFDFGSPHLNQQLVSKVIELGIFDEHVSSLQKNYARKARVTLDALDKFLGRIDGVTWLAPAGGLYVWLTLPEHVDAGARGKLFDAAVKKGMLYVPGEFCFPSDGAPVKHNTIRLTFGVQDSPEIERGIELLSEAIAELI